MPEPPHIPYLSNERLRREAEAFLGQTHPSKSIPVPIEVMVERLGVDIVPVPNLQRTFDLVGCTSADMTCIYVDQRVAESRESRYRFTLAHEIGHVRLHPQIFECLRRAASTANQWQDFIGHVPDMLYRSMEWQANMFAGLVLVTPAHLKREYEHVAAEVCKMMKAAAQESIPREQVVDMAWDELVTRLAPPFGVSEDVIRRRLEFDGFKPEDL